MGRGAAGGVQANVAAAVAAERWVCDGNYGKVRDLVWGRATTVIWLDYRFTTVMRRALYRTLRRAITREELFSGNRESIRMALFSRGSILWWVVTTHRRRREQYNALFAGSAFPHLERVVLTSPAEATRFLNASERVASGGAARHTSP